jgi:hypothetical protein
LDGFSPGEKSVLATQPERYFLSRCRVAAFCMSGPIESTFMVLSDSPDQEEDIAVSVHGPWSASDFVREVAALLDQEPWRRPMPNGVTAGEAFGTALHGHFAMLKQGFPWYLFTGASLLYAPRELGLCMQLPQGQCSLDPRAVALDAVQRIRLIRVTSEAVRTGHVERLPAPPPRDYVGTVFFPLVALDDPEPHLTIEARIVHGRISAPRKVVARAADDTVVIYSDGLVLVPQSGGQQAALHRLNLVFAAASIAGMRCDAARGNDVHSFAVDPHTLTIVGSQGFMGSLRARMLLPIKMGSPHDDDYATPVPAEAFVRVLRVAVLAAKDQDVGTELVFLLQARTFHGTGEHEQALVLAWLIVEKHIARIWDQCLIAKGIASGKRWDKLHNPDSWTADRKLELLNVSGRVEDADLGAMMRFKTIRNAFVHRGARVQTKDVADLLDFTAPLVEARVEALGAS